MGVVTEECGLQLKDPSPEVDNLDDEASGNSVGVTELQSISQFASSNQASPRTNISLSGNTSRISQEMPSVPNS